MTDPSPSYSSKNTRIRTSTRHKDNNEATDVQASIERQTRRSPGSGLLRSRRQASSSSAAAAMSTSGSSGNPVQTGKMSDRHDSSIYHPLRDDCFDRIDTPSMAEDGISINDYDDDASIFTANSFIDQQGSPSKGFCRSDKSDLLKLVYGDANKLSPGDDEDDEDFNEESQCLNPKQKNKIASKSKRNSKSSLKSKGWFNSGSSLADEEFITAQNTPAKTSFTLARQSSRLAEKDIDPSSSDFECHSDSNLPIVNESSFSIFIQVFIPFLIAGFGTVGAGIVLDYVQHWEVFRNVNEVFILVPALLGLKGNLEMTLASRLSTAANVGMLDSGENRWKLAVANIALVQCQSAVVGFLAAAFAIAMDWIPQGNFNMPHAILLVASSLLTAMVASFVLAIVMIVVVILSHQSHINPDNVATPIAASLGDLTTLTLLANISSLLYYTVNQQVNGAYTIWLCLVLTVVLVLLIPVWVVIAYGNSHTRDVLYHGWAPIVSAMAISSVGGIILDFAVSKFTGIAVYQPVINGVGGNLVAVQASRISTYLHQKSILGVLPRDQLSLCDSPLNAFCGSHIHAKTARVLLAISLPGHCIFTYAIFLIQAGHTRITPTFLALYFIAAMTQIIVLLIVARTMIHYMWLRKIDPDNSAIPYLTALGDLIGTGLLALAFVLYEPELR